MSNFRTRNERLQQTLLTEHNMAVWLHDWFYLLTFQRPVNWYRLDIPLICSERRRNGVLNLIVGRQIGSRTPPDSPPRPVCVFFEHLSLALALSFSADVEKMYCILLGCSVDISFIYLPDFNVACTEFLAIK